MTPISLRHLRRFNLCWFNFAHNSLKFFLTQKS